MDNKILPHLNALMLSSVIASSLAISSTQVLASTIKPYYNDKRIESKFFQDQTITGKVVDENGQGLPGVNIKIKGTTKGTSTDSNGNFKFTIPDKGDATLVFSMIGYKTQEMTVGGRTVFNIILSSDNKALDEVVVVGYGTQKKNDVTGSVSVIKASQFENQPLTNAAQALAGKVAGVNLNQNSGLAGDDNSKIVIRGTGTLGNSDPLIIIDGVIATTESTPQFNASGGSVPSKSINPLNSIDPTDIESITVLKDASAASIYGSRASNGVILVTTKRGKESSKPTIKYNGYYGVSSATSLPKMISNTIDFMTIANEAAVNSGKSPSFSTATMNTYKGFGNMTNTNWMDLLFQQSAAMSQHDLSISGGNANTNYYISFGVLNQDAIVTQGNYQRYNTRLNIDSKVLNNFKVGTSLTFSRGEQNMPSSDILYVSVLDAMRATPVMPAYTSDGKLAILDGYSFSALNSIQAGNALARSAANQVVSTTQSFLGSGYADWEIIKDLHLRGSVTVNINPYDRFDWASNLTGYNWRYQELLTQGYKLSDLTGALSTASLTLTNSESKRINPYAQLSYNKTIGKHQMGIMAGYSYEKNTWTYNYTSRRNFSSNETRILSAGDPSTQNNGGTATQNALVSQFGRLNYTYDGKYLFEATVRRDGSSRFGVNNRFGVFPAFSLGWVMTSEDFMKQQNVIDFLKIRASWGQLGNQYASSDFPYVALIGFGNNYNFNNVTVGGAVQTTYGNPDLKWETSTTTNIGFDLFLFKSKLSIVADAYQKKATGIIYNTPLPSNTGFSSVTSNLASVQNKGIELAVNYNDKIGDVSFSIGGNAAYNKNELIYINPESSDEKDRVIDGNYALLRGQPVDALYGLKVIGIFQNQSEVDNSPKQFSGTAPGDLKYEDLNKDGKIDANDRQVLGKESPTWVYGFNASVSYKKFTLSAQFQGIGDAQTYGSYEYFIPTFQGSNFGEQWLNRWTPSNPSTTMPRVWDTSGPNTQMTNSFFVQDRSFLRMKNITLEYNFKDLIKNNFFKNLKVYVSGQNLLTWTNFKGFDPEKSARLDRSGIPQVKIFSAGVNVEF